jgi:hypothetical protein
MAGFMVTPLRSAGGMSMLREAKFYRRRKPLAQLSG